MNRVALIGCSKNKRTEPCAAEQLYTGVAFRMCLELVKKNGLEFAILSARYGLVMPGQIIAPYNKTLLAAPKIQLNSWGMVVKAQMAKQWPAGGGVILLAPSCYGVGIPSNFQFEEPMKGLGQGERMNWLNAQLRKTVCDFTR